MSALALAVLFATAAASSAETIAVTRFDDPAADGCATNGCSLREAVGQANGTGGVQVVEIPEGQTVNLTQGVIQITGDMEISSGNGIATVHSNGSRVFDVTAAGDVTIKNLVITGGSNATSGCGGGVRNAGTLQMTNSAVSDNSITGTGGGLCNTGTATIEDTEFARNAVFGGPGGGVYNNGTMTIMTSTVIDNSSHGQGSGGDGAGIGNGPDGEINIQYTTILQNAGNSDDCDDCSSGAGISNEGDFTMEWSTVKDNIADNGTGMENSGSATIRRTTFSGNQGGALLNSKDSVLTISNSTISGNQGLEYPKNGVGGITNSGSVNLLSTTIANNTGLQFFVGGLFNNTTGGATYKATIFANNGQKNCNTAGSHISNGFNVVSDATCAHVGSDQGSTDAMLGGLADNGGPTLTHMPSAGSPAIDNGGPGCPSPDQRNAPRTGGCDAGSVEFGSTPITPTPTPSPTPPPLTYPIGDPTCDDKVNQSDIAAELKLVAGLEEPTDCGRSTVSCFEYANECWPVWVDTDCNQIVDAADVLRIALNTLDLDSPINGCPDVGTYPAVPLN